MGDLFLIFENSSGVGLFKVLDKNFNNVDKNYKIRSTNLISHFKTVEKTQAFMQLVEFRPFEDVCEGALFIKQNLNGKSNKIIKGLVKKVSKNDTIAVGDAKLGTLIKDKFDIQCQSSGIFKELTRLVRLNNDALMGDIAPSATRSMAFGLAHSLSRHKLMFTPDKIDMMIGNAVGTLEDCVKMLNNLAMKCKEWYGWHFPELQKILPDNNTYLRFIIQVNYRENIEKLDLSDFLNAEQEAKVKQAASYSCGTQFTEEDMKSCVDLATRYEKYYQCRLELEQYLSKRMMAVAPNLTTLVGELVGAKLISRAGTLTGLAKSSASTIQLFGAEKALFKAIKAKGKTPKFGYIYHSALVAQANTQAKGGAARKLAAKAAICARVDAFGDEDASQTLGDQHKSYLQNNIRALESRLQEGRRGQPGFTTGPQKYNKGAGGSGYKSGMDATSFKSSKKRVFEHNAGEASEPEAKKFKPLIEDITDQKLEEETAVKSPKKKKNKKAAAAAEEGSSNATTESVQETPAPEGEKKKKKKKRSIGETVELKVEAVEEVADATSEPPKKKKKKNKHAQEEEVKPEVKEEIAEVSTELKKKKKKKKRQAEE